MYGWAGNLLDINLTTGEITRKPIDSGYARKWLGGEGFGAKILWDNVGPEVADALDEGNVLIYTAGALTGTMAPSTGRLEIITRSPLTGSFGDSNSGGHFAPELKAAGYDGVVIRGKASQPVYIWINDDDVQIRKASHLWGKTVSETDRHLKQELGDEEIQVSCIGPAGENKVRFAILVNNLVRAPGWAGCGAVAGSKNLKAVVVRGTKGIRIARPEDFERACFDTRAKTQKLQLLPTMRRMGTMFLIRGQYLRGVGQLHNYNITQCPESHVEKIAAENWVAENVTRNTGCHGCALHCSHYSVIKNGPYAGLSTEGFEYGAITGFIYSYGAASLPFGMEAVRLCNEYGIDASQPGYLLAWATDCQKRGLLGPEESDGLNLDWGDEKVGLELIRRMTYREGYLGNLLAEGLGKAARMLGKGSEYYAQTIKGKFSQENSTRASYGRALASSTSTRGADHLKGWPNFEDQGVPPEIAVAWFGDARAGDGKSHKGKTLMNTYYRHICTLMDSLGTCKFPSRWMCPMDGLDENDYCRLLSAATGMDFTVEELMTTAKRIYTLEQAFNIRFGFSRKDDTIPEMYFKEPFNTGPLKGHILKKKNFNEMLDEYYRHWGWDAATGIPTRETLDSLGLKDVADDLDGRGLLPETKSKIKVKKSK